jgi:hypothetical protein
MRNWTLVILICISSLAVAADKSDHSPDTGIDKSINIVIPCPNCGAITLYRVGKSSVWLDTKSEYDKFKTEGTLVLGMPFVTLRGEITRADIPVFGAILAPYLDSNYLKNHPKPHWFKPNPDDVGYMVSLDSEGGDVAAAMEIGRMFRKARVNTIVGKGDKCLSACIFLLAGSVKRTYVGDAVGIHRPYSADTEAITFEAMQQRTTNLGNLASRFLKEMNIPSTLYDAMTQVPPEQIKILDDIELDHYGLKADDPVFSELNRNAEARAAGLSKSDYLARKVAYDQCVENRVEHRVGINGEIRLNDMIEYHKIKDECWNEIILSK